MGQAADEAGNGGECRCRNCIATIPEIQPCCGQSVPGGTAGDNLLLFANGPVTLGVVAAQICLKEVESMHRWLLPVLVIATLVGGLTLAADNVAPEGFVPLFNGKDLTGWKVPAGDNGHWKVVNGVIDYDARSEAAGDKSLWTEKSYKDYVLRLDWRLKLEPAYKNQVPVILADGTHLKDAAGKEVRVEIDDADTGVYMRGSPKGQVNIWMWPIGSGEVYGYRNDAKQPAAVRAGVTPKKRMDQPRGEWNSFEITMKGDRLTVVLNGTEVLKDAELPGIPPEGPLALQHHGSWNAKANRWNGPPSLVQFKNIYIKELK